ncbi:MAG: MMPL family transporter [Patescibacteria group bacterium]|nr:MMPL family transporter [Patescibacteria group bacterium]
MCKPPDCGGEHAGHAGHQLPRGYAAAVLVLALLSLPWMAIGVRGALRGNTNDPRQWLPRGFQETDTYVWLQEHFGSDEITVVSWPGCTLDDVRAERLAEALLEEPQTALFQRALTGRQVLNQLTSPPLDLPHHEAVERLRGVFIGPDGQTTCVLLTIAPRGVENRAAAIRQVFETAERACGLKPDDLRLGGPTVDAATIDIESQRLLLQLAAMAGVVAFAIAWLRLGSLRVAVIVLAIAVYGTGAALSILYYTGGTMNLVMTMLPPLVYVLGISAAVHLVNYYRDACREGAGRAAPLRALVDGWKPCTLASGTTAIGLFSLAFSRIVPVRMFGIYGGVGMLASLAVVLLLLPVALSLWPGREEATGGQTNGGGRSRRVELLVAVLCRHRTAVIAGCLLLMVGTGAGLPWLRSTVKLQYRFGADSRIIRDYRWLEQHLGPLVPLELVIHFSHDTDVEFLEQLAWVDRLQKHVEQLPDVGAAMSAASFAPLSPTGAFARDAAERAVLKRNVPLLRQRLRQARFLADGRGGEQLWRISVRAPALSNIDYGRFVETLREQLDPAVENAPGVRVTYTGVIPLIYKAQRALLNDLTESFFMAFLMIALVMICVLRSPTAGLLAMLPNVFPAVVVFGLMGWFGVWIEIGSIMTASAAMGIAVDDTFHFLAWFRTEAGKGRSRHQSLRVAFSRCAGAMVHTTLIGAGGMLVFSLSSFMPIVRFAWLMAILLLVALLGDLIFLPALLASPLGKRFVPRQPRR